MHIKNGWQKTTKPAAAAITERSSKKETLQLTRGEGALGVSA